MKHLLLSSVVALCAMFVSSALVAKDAPREGEKPEGDTPVRALEATPERPFKVLIRQDDSVKPGEVSVTVGDEGVRHIRVHPRTPHDVVRRELEKLNVPTPHTADGNVMFRLNPAATRPGNQAARPATIAAARPPVDPDFVQLLEARLQHATQVLRYKQAAHQAGSGTATDADISAAELAVKEAQFALKKASQPWPMMQPPMMPSARLTPAMNPEAAAMRKAYTEQLAEQLLEFQEEFVEKDAAFKSGGEEDADAVSWLRAKIVYLDAAARFYREAGVPDRLMESQRDRAKAVQMLVRVLEKKSKQENIGEEDRKELQKQLQNARIIAAEATGAPAVTMRDAAFTRNPARDKQIPGNALSIPDDGFESAEKLMEWAGTSSGCGGRAQSVARDVYCVVRSLTSGRATAEVIIFVKKEKDTAYRPAMIIPTRFGEASISVDDGVLKLQYTFNRETVDFLSLNLDALRK